MSDSRHSKADRLEKLVTELVNRKPLVQAIVAVETGDGSFRWTGTRGTDSGGNQVTEKTPFFLASIDKLFNATVAMLLSEAGRLDLDETITAYLPSALTRRLHVIDGSDLTDRITVRHLLSHASGLADCWLDRPKGGRSLVDRVLEEGDREFTTEEMMAFVRDELKPHFPPQDLSAGRPKIRYSDTNFLLVIAIIEAVTGQPLHKIHEQLLHEPLGLRHTWFAGLSRPAEQAPDPMILRANGQPVRLPLLIQSFRGMYSTAGDTLAFLRALAHGEVFRNPATPDAMHGRWHRFGFPLDRAALQAPGWPIEYGLGIMRFRLPRVFTPLRPLPGVVGHSGSTGCWLFWCPQWDVFLCGSVDEVTAGAIPYRMMPKVLDAVRPAS